MKKEIFESIFKTSKPIIGMVHFNALPGSPLYNEEEGIKGILESAKKDVFSLQEAGIDAIMFGNENDRPYLTTVDSVTIATMSYLIGRLKNEINVPHGVDVLFDSKATLAVAKATDCKFVREVFTNVYTGDLGFWNNNCGEALRYRDFIKGNNIITMFNISAEFAYGLDKRQIEDIARSTVFSSLPDILLVSGNITGEAVELSIIKKVKDVLPDSLVFANTGVNINNVDKILGIADGAIVGTSFKKDGSTWKEVEKERVLEFMKKVKEIRKS
ncbi:MAG: BtpA/SgcQ family protein [Candidatus Humimicrobiaceae bacterium]